MSKKRVKASLSRKVDFPYKTFPLYIKRETRKDSLYPVHYHSSEIEFQFIHQGSGYYFIKHRRYPAVKNSVFIIRRNEVHSFVLTPPSPFLKKTSLLCSPSLLSRTHPFLRDRFQPFLEHAPTFQHQIHLTEKETILVDLILKELIQEMAEQQTYWKEMAVMNLASLCVVLQRAMRRQKKSLRPLDSPGRNQIMEKAVSYIEAHFAENIGLKELAAAVFCSPFYLSHLFRVHTGLTFREYLARRRIMEARKFLEEEKGKIVTVAAAVGLELRSFYRNFRKLTGLTPRMYRKFCH